jgi:signal transduction histidine kinase/DNA-binding NarL/FixJ family response regulator/HPt (histidine-containing phosphotransfer) domain-containing protein
LKYLLPGAILLLFLCSCAAQAPDVREKPFYIDLNDYPLYVKNGFDSASAAAPDLAGSSWLLKRPEERGVSNIEFLGLPESPERFFLSPFREKVREYTMVIPFTVNPEQFAYINGKAPFQPGIFLASLGDNWEIFLNGEPIKSELHLDEKGQIRSGRGWRYVSIPLDRSFFVRGTNILIFRIIGMPHADITGMWYDGPYYIDDYEAIRKDHDESVELFICGAYLLVGIYHFLIFLTRPKYRDNLYHSIFSILLSAYFLMRSNTIYRFIPNSDISFRIEYLSLYLLMPLLLAFLEHLNFEKTTGISRVYMGISLFFAAIQAIFPHPFGDDLLHVWWAFALLGLIYTIGYDIVYVFSRNIRVRWKAAGKHSYPKAFWKSLIGTPLGNVIIGSSIMCVTAGIDIVSSINSRYGIVNVSKYGVFVFTMTTAIILARRFGRMFRRLDEANLLLEKSNLNLEATIQERTRELEQQTEVAESASRAKSIFLARMSHEIRTPLNAILGLSEVELQGELPDRTRIDLEKIYRSGSHLLEIVNDILDISKIETGNFEIFPAEYEFAGMINDAVQLNIMRIGSKPIEFKLELDETIPSRLYGDELRFKQILSNLLSNAFKYTEEGEVRLRIGWEKTGDAALICFTVEDTGRGIRQADLEKVFSEYTQFDTTVNRHIEGTGLGLSITKGLLEMMGGSITAESEYGKGSVFRVVLAQGIRDEKPIGAGIVDKLRHFRFIEDRSRSRGNTLIRSWMPYGKVLVVDDLQTNLDVMTGLLMPYGLMVDRVLSGREAVERIKAEEIRYDLIFMDHMMPEMDGVEAARFIRNKIDSDYAQRVPIVVLTANAIAGNREMFLESGFNDFIAKPIDIKQLDLVLNQWVRDIQSEETLKEAETQAWEREESRKTEGPEKETAGGIDAEGRWLLEHPVEGIDFTAAMSLYGNSGAALIPILQSFVTHTPSLIAKMDAHLETSLADYAVEAHGLKGTCNIICATETAVLARELEFASKEGKGDIVKNRHGELRRQALGLTEGISEALNNWKLSRPREEKELKNEPERELLIRLAEAAGEFNSNKIEETLGKLERYKYEKGEELIVWLREQAENFDYDLMYKRLEELLDHG